jgi:hypothetical protein
MALDQTSFRTILAAILLIDPKYIVPKQGNWFNPQDIELGENKPDTWVAFKIRKGEPVNMPMLQPVTDHPDRLASVSWYISFCDIQFNGKRAELLAQSVAHWIHRADVKAQLRTIDAEMMASDTSYKVDSYYQDGLNTNLAFRVTIKVFHTSAIETNQTRWLATDPENVLFV